MSAERTTSVDKSITDDDTLRKLLYSFSDKVIRDFVAYVASTLKIPVSLWLFNGDEANLFHVLPNETIELLPEFCRSMTLPTNPLTNCSEFDEQEIRQIHQLVENKSPERCQTYKIAKCSLGVNRLVFPLEVEGYLLGVFVAGKFKTTAKDEDTIITSQVDKFIHDIAKNLSEDERKSLIQSLIQRISSIPIMTAEETEDLGRKINSLLPMIKTFCATNSARGAHLQSLLFLEDLEKSFTDIVASEMQLWDATIDYLQKTAKRLRLKNAFVLHSERDSFVNLQIMACWPSGSQEIDHLLLASTDEYLWLTSLNRGILLPRLTGKYLSWISEDLMKKLFDAKNGILYAGRLYDGKLLLIGFGFTDDVILSQFERLLLRKSASRLSQIINKGLSSVETDILMSETGHMLRRATAKIYSGLSDIISIGLEPKATDTLLEKAAKELAVPTINSGLFRLDLIQRNFEAFRNLRETKMRPIKTQQVDELVDIDVLSTIRNSMKAFEPELRIVGKRYEYRPSLGNWILHTNRDLFELLLLNLLDNAEKFSYRDTYIDVWARNEGNYNVLTIANLGVGFAQAESELVFTRYYQSVYVSPVRKRSGTGVGLAYCKLFMNLFFPDPKGKIEIKSTPNRSREARFPGDNYTTAVTVRFQN